MERLRDLGRRGWAFARDLQAEWTKDRVSGLADRMMQAVGQSAADGALPTLRAATDPDVIGGDDLGPAGFGELRGPGVRVKARAKALDVHDARALWEASVELTGIDYAALEPS